jgi:hypothetical protein
VRNKHTDPIAQGIKLRVLCFHLSAHPLAMKVLRSSLYAAPEVKDFVDDILATSIRCNALAEARISAMIQERKLNE